MVDHVGHGEQIEPDPHPGEMLTARVAQVVQEVRRVGGGGPALVGLAVEHPQRVLKVPLAVCRAQLVGPLG